MKVFSSEAITKIENISFDLESAVINLQLLVARCEDEDNVAFLQQALHAVAYANECLSLEDYRS